MEINLESVVNKTYLIKTFFIAICTFITLLKIINANNVNKRSIIKMCICLFVISIFTTCIKYNINSFIAIVWLTFSIGLLCAYIIKINLGYSILITVISLGFNYIVFVAVLIIIYIINKNYIIENDYINLNLMIMVHLIFLFRIFKIRKLKNGINFFNKNSQDEYFDAVILNISIIILFSTIAIANRVFLISASFFIGFVLFTIVMFITIQKSLQLYYKHKLLVKELEETKSELDNKNKEIEKLEQENLSFSKRSHSLAHKQKALEFKLNQLLLKTETAEELDVKDKLENISKELYEEKATIELTKTGIEEIDTMLSCMQSECKTYNIDFDLQITGNIYYMINNLVTKEELEILLADHIKDAIIAINHCENINKSILVRLGEIDNCYGLYIYDSGIEFEKETLRNLGKKPYTTHTDEGGTGMGYMNTFDTLRRHNASLIINEIGKPCKENFTKIIMIKFDGNNEFKVISYKDNVETKKAVKV